MIIQLPLIEKSIFEDSLLFLSHLFTCGDSLGMPVGGPSARSGSRDSRWGRTAAQAYRAIGVDFGCPGVDDRWVPHLPVGRDLPLLPPATAIWATRSRPWRLLRPMGAHAEPPCHCCPPAMAGIGDFDNTGLGAFLEAPSRGATGSGPCPEI